MQIPMTLGTTIRQAPATPLLEGNPMENENCPEKSYIPHVNMTDNTLCTVSEREREKEKKRKREKEKEKKRKEREEEEKNDDGCVVVS